MKNRYNYQNRALNTSKHLVPHLTLIELNKVLDIKDFKINMKQKQ